ncbi:MAG: hypothetical protein IIT37_07440 [Bacteroidales bacterium]|nr:hypothetical protein [Bacteroidales bacterium]
MQKVFLTLTIVASLLVATYLTSCLKDGTDTIIVEGSAKAEPEPEPEPEPESEPEPNADVDQSDLQGESGGLRFNIQWETRDDIDIHVVDPCDNEIFFANRECECNGSIGSLDIDANSEVFPEHPQENIYWKKPSPGQYRVYIQNFTGWQSFDRVKYKLTIIYNNKRTDLQEHTERGEIKLVYTLDVE